MKIAAIAPYPSRALRRRGAEGRTRRRLKKKFLVALFLLMVFSILALALVLKSLPIPIRRRNEGVTTVAVIRGLNRPLAVAGDDRGRLYVADTGNGRLMVYDSRGRHLRELRGPRRRPFSGILGLIVIEGKGRTYVADWQRRIISVYGRHDRLIDEFPDNQSETKAFAANGFIPFGMDVYRNQVIVAASDGLYFFSLKGEFLKKIGSKGAGDGQFDYPTAVAVDKRRGDIYVADQLNGRVVAMTSTGKTRWTVGGVVDGRKAAFFVLPRGVAVDRRGRVFVADTFLHRVVVLDRDGKLLSVFGKAGNQPGGFRYPEGIAFDRFERLLVADRENNRVQVILIKDLPKPTKAQRDQFRRAFRAFDRERS